MIRARIRVDGRFQGDLQALLGAPIAPYSGLGKSFSGRIWSVRLAGDAAALGEGLHVSIDRERQRSNSTPNPGCR